MPSLDERVAALEARVDEHAIQLADLRGGFAEIRQEICEFRAAVDRRFEAMDRRFDAMDRRFGWVVGIVITGFVMTIGTIAGAFWGLLQVVRG